MQPKGVRKLKPLSHYLSRVRKPRRPQSDPDMRVIAYLDGLARRSAAIPAPYTNPADPAGGETDGRD